MRISKLLMPAVTVAGALALAGCGGGSSTPTVTTDPSTGLRGSGPDGAITNADCARLNGTGSTANAGGTGCTGGDNTQTAQGSLTPAALLIASGPNKDNLNEDRASSDAFRDLLRAQRKAKADGKANDLIFDSGTQTVNIGEKWHEALGAKKVTLSDGNGGSFEAQALKVTGQDTDDFTGGSPATSDKGTVIGGFTYKGIPNGSLICNGDSCGISDDDKLTGDWYFFSTNAADWVKEDGEDDYVAHASVPYAEWGVWLEGDAVNSGSGKQVRLFWDAHVARGADDDGVLETTGLDGLPTSANKATYTGDAGGVSKLVTKNGDDETTTVGDFTATATLTAEFNDSQATLEGKITDFKGSAANDKWELTLMKTGLANTGGLEAGGQTDAFETRGGGSLIATHGADDAPANYAWNAQAYGEENKRPEGFVGFFDGRFTDGQAVGVFHAD